MRIPGAIKMFLLFDPGVLTLGFYFKERIQLLKKAMCEDVFIALLVLIGKKWR